MLEVFLLLPLFFQVAPPPPAPPVQTNVNVHSDITVQVPPPDPEVTAQMAGDSFAGIVILQIAPTVTKWANDLLDIPDFVRTTPPDLSYKNSGVLSLASIVRGVAFALIGLSILAWAVPTILRGYGGPPGNIIYGAALAIGNLVWWQWGIELNNRINNAIAAPTLGSIARPHLTVPTLTATPADAFGPAVLVIATAIVVALLVLAMFMRLAFLDILLVAGSLALMAKSTSQTERFAETYISMATGTLFSQIAVVIALKLATILGFVTGGIAGTLLSIAILLLARRMPGLLSSRFNTGGGIRLAAVTQVVRRVAARV